MRKRWHRHRHSCQKFKFKEADIKEVLNIGNDAPVMPSLSDGGIAEMIIVTDNHEDIGDYDDNKIVNTGGRIPIDNMVKSVALTNMYLSASKGLWQFTQFKWHYLDRNLVNETYETYLASRVSDDGLWAHFTLSAFFL